jgi:predicted transcriptional regulator
MELPYHLKALPPEALDVIRYFSGLDSPIARADEITNGVGLSDRTFGKVIRRLVTKGYLQMDGDQAYRLSDQGQTAVEELAEYDESAPTEKPKREVIVEQLPRRLLLAAPSKLVAGQPTPIYVGFHPAKDDKQLSEPADVVIRLNVLNGDPARPQELAFQLSNESDQQTFTVTPGLYQCLRIRANVFQLGPNPDDIAVAGGLYVDLDVTAEPDDTTRQLAAYGGDIVLTQALE